MFCRYLFMIFSASFIVGFYAWRSNSFLSPKFSGLFTSYWILFNEISFLLLKSVTISITFKDWLYKAYKDENIIKFYGIYNFSPRTISDYRSSNSIASTDSSFNKLSNLFA
jgi:hypothetical protein